MGPGAGSGGGERAVPAGERIAALRATLVTVPCRRAEPPSWDNCPTLRNVLAIVHRRAADVIVTNPQNTGGLLGML